MLQKLPPISTAKSLPSTHFQSRDRERHSAPRKELGHRGGFRALSLLTADHGQAERHGPNAGAGAGKPNPNILANWPDCAKGHGRVVGMAEMHNGPQLWGKMTQCHNAHMSAMTRSCAVARARAATSSRVHPADREGFVALHRVLTTALTWQGNTGARLVKGDR
jgi:hypothetical protein